MMDARLRVPPEPFTKTIVVYREDVDRGHARCRIPIVGIRPRNPFIDISDAIAVAVGQDIYILDTSRALAAGNRPQRQRLLRRVECRTVRSIADFLHQRHADRPTRVAQRQGHGLALSRSYLAAAYQPNRYCILIDLSKIIWTLDCPQPHYPAPGRAVTSHSERQRQFTRVATRAIRDPDRRAGALENDVAGIASDRKGGCCQAGQQRERRQCSKIKRSEDGHRIRSDLQRARKTAAGDRPARLLPCATHRFMTPLPCLLR